MKTGSIVGPRQAATGVGDFPSLSPVLHYNYLTALKTHSMRWNISNTAWVAKNIRLDRPQA